jgi:hypothetical protein
LFLLGVTSAAGVGVGVISAVGVVAFIAENYDVIIINSSTLALQVLKTPSVLGASPLPPHARVFFDARAKVAAGSKIIVNPADR